MTEVPNKMNTIARTAFYLALLTWPTFGAFAECELEGKINSFGVDGKVIIVKVTESDGTQKRVVKFCSNVAQGTAFSSSQSPQALEYIRLAMRNNYRVCLNSSEGLFESCVDEIKIQNARFEN
jgi:hypothetical protein